jgi:hypothetical protein
MQSTTSNQQADEVASEEQKAVPISANKNLKLVHFVAFGCVQGKSPERVANPHKHSL